MFAKLLLLFTLLPFVELLLLIYIADQTNFLFTVGLILVTGVVGAFLARWQGVQTVAKIRRDLAEGRPPADSLVDGLLILVAGAVLLTPGILTDLFGFVLLIPPLRMLVKRYVGRRIRASLHIQTPQGSWTGGDRWDEQPRRDEVIEGRVVESAEDDRT